MTSLKHSPMVRVVTLLAVFGAAGGAHAKAISKCSPSICSNVSSPFQGSGTARTVRPLATREELLTLGNALANCPKNVKTCDNLFDEGTIAIMLRYNPWRADGRDKNPMLNFDDFTGFHRIFGNALAKLVSQDILGETVNQWVFNESADNDKCHTIVVDHLIGYDAASTEVYEGPVDRETTVRSLQRPSQF